MRVPRAMTIGDGVRIEKPSSGGVITSRFAACAKKAKTSARGAATRCRRASSYTQLRCHGARWVTSIDERDHRRVLVREAALRGDRGILRLEREERGFVGSLHDAEAE